MQEQLILVLQVEAALADRCGKQGIGGAPF